MQLKPEDISKIIKSQIKNYDSRIECAETGTVILVGDGIARAYGLEKCMANELVEFENGEYGMALNLEENSVAIVLLGSDEGIREGDTVRRTGRVVSVPVGEALIGRVVNALGQPIDGKGPVDAAETRPIERKAPGIIERKSVSVPLQTGIKAIDSMIPIGRGQRELIIGDRQTGKTVPVEPARPSVFRIQPAPLNAHPVKAFRPTVLRCRGKLQLHALLPVAHVDRRTEFPVVLPHWRYLITTCFTLSRTSARLASLKRSTVPTK